MLKISTDTKQPFHLRLKICCLKTNLYFLVQNCFLLMVSWTLTFDLLTKQSKGSWSFKSLLSSYICTCKFGDGVTYNAKDVIWQWKPCFCPKGSVLITDETINFGPVTSWSMFFSSHWTLINQVVKRWTYGLKDNLCQPKLE